MHVYVYSCHRHHPPNNDEQGADHAANRAARARYVRVEPIKLPATSLPDSLQTLLLENVELRRKEVGAMGARLARRLGDLCRTCGAG